MSIVFQLVLFILLIWESWAFLGGKISFDKDGAKFEFNKKRAEKAFLKENKIPNFKKYVQEYWQQDWLQKNKKVKKKFQGTKLSNRAIDWFTEMHRYVPPRKAKAGRTGRRRRRGRKCTKKMRRRGRCKRDLLQLFFDTRADSPTLDREKRQGPECPLIPQPPVLERKEWRRMSAVDRASFIVAFNSLAATPAPGFGGLTQHQALVEQHRVTNAPSAHEGAGFFPWHREYLWRFSNMMRSHGYTGALPYWDHTLDLLMPNPADAAIWTNSHFGVSSGTVSAPWILQSIPACEKQGSTLLRRDMLTHGGAHALMMDDVTVNTIVSMDCFQDLTKGWNSFTEDSHDRILLLMGTASDAQMADPNCAPTDPCYWLHTTFMDYLWERNRQQKNFGVREIQYPITNLVDPASSINPMKHRWKAKMKPFFGLINAHGMSNHYTSYYYHYQDSPSVVSCVNDFQCNLPGNDMLWCAPNNRCLSKIRLEGQCVPAWPPNQCHCPPGLTGQCNGNTLLCECV